MAASRGNTVIPPCLPHPSPAPAGAGAPPPLQGELANDGLGDEWACAAPENYEKDKREPGSRQLQRLLQGAKVRHLLTGEAPAC